MLRKNFDEELEQLHKEILLMSSVVEEMLRDSVASLAKKDIELAEEVIEKDDIVDQKEVDIQELCVVLIATQQPVASDLRKVTAAFKIINNLERIADNAVNIARVTRKLVGQKYFKELIDIPKMADLVIELVKDTIDAYVNKDLSRQNSILERENEIDSIWRELKKELIKVMNEQNQYADQIFNFLFVASHLERVADHAINILESVHYIVNGKYVDF